MNLLEAGVFIETLAGEVDAPCTFQTFDDTEWKTRPAKIIHGRITEARTVDKLAYEQIAGAGIFLTINATDSKGRSAENILSVRAVFVDADGTELALDDRTPKPTMIVQSVRGKHAYWVLDGSDKLEDFTPAQERLAATYGTDTKIKDLPRVMRLPGTWHQKGKPQMVRICELNKVPLYTIDEVLKNVPRPKEIIYAKGVAWCARSGASFSDRLEQARRYLAKVPPAVEGAYGDDATFRAACMVANDFDLSDDEALGLLHKWNAQCEPPWREQDLLKKLNGARKYANRPRGNKLREVINTGARL